MRFLNHTEEPGAMVGLGGLRGVHFGSSAKNA